MARGTPPGRSLMAQGRLGLMGSIEVEHWMHELIPRTVVSEVVGWRNAALAKTEEAVNLMARGYALAEEAESLAKKAHDGHFFQMHDRSKTDEYRRIFTDIDPARALAVYRDHLDARVWLHLMSRTGMSDLMDRTERDKMYDSLCKDGVPEVTEENVYGTLRALAENARLIFQRGLARVFCELDRRFKSHDGFKVGSRIILTYVFDGTGFWNYHTRAGEALTDIERVFAVLDKQTPNAGELRSAIDASRRGTWGPRQASVTTRYFKVNTFKNGNAHLWFTRDDLVEKVNLELAAYYGPVLPDAVPRESTPEDIRSKTGALVKDLSFYPTPEAVVERLLERLGRREGGARVLEPSAGTGNIVKGLLARADVSHVEAVEVDPGRAAVMRATIWDPRLKVVQENFLQMRPRPIFDAVVMNPPFYGTHWMQHVMHAFDFLAPGGELVSVLPVTAMIGESKQHEAFRAWALGSSSGWRRTFEELPPESFAESGTRINTVILHMARKRTESA